MPEDRAKLREVAWLDVFPWLHMFRAAQLAVGPRMLLLGALGICLTSWGWQALAYVFSGSEDPWLTAVREDYARAPWSVGGARSGYVPGSSDLWAPPALDDNGANPLVSVRFNLSAPFRHLFHFELSVTSLAFVLACAIWASAVWALFGAAASRFAVVKLAREQAIGIGAALKFARRKWFQSFISPLFPLSFVALCAGFTMVMGWIASGDVGASFTAVVWPIVIVPGILMALATLCLLAGWPLMYPTIGAEGLDSFDALTRSYSYPVHRPFHMIAYALVASLLGIVGMAIVTAFAEATLYLATWGVSWGAGAERMTALLVVAEDDAMLEAFAGRALGFWSDVARTFAAGFAYSYFWSAASCMYLLLRWHVDGQEMDEVYLDEPPEPILPPSPAGNGVPQEAPVSAESASPASSSQSSPAESAPSAAAPPA